MNELKGDKVLIESVRAIIDAWEFNVGCSPGTSNLFCINRLSLIFVQLMMLQLTRERVWPVVERNGRKQRKNYC